jgi:hypothetical protein
MNRLCQIVLFIAVVGRVWAADVATTALTVLRDNCLRCHGEDKRKGGLALHSREAVLEGGDEGPAVLLKEPLASPLVRSLAADADPHMPPKKQLSADAIKAVSRWIEAGLPWDDAALRRLPAREVKAWGSLAAGYRPVGALAPTADGRRLAVAKGNLIDLFELGGESPRRVAGLKGHRDVVQSLAWSPDGSLLVSGGYRRVLVWDAAGKQLRELSAGLAGRVTGLTFTKDGRQLVVADSVASVGAQLQVFNVADWETVKRFPAHTDAIYDVALSADGTRLATASADKLTRLWSTDGWTEEGTLEGHTDYVLAVAFAPDGDRIATGSADATIKVWNVATRKQISTFSDRKSELAITGLHWRRNPEAKKDKNDDWIISISEDRTPRLYTDLVVHDGAQRSDGARLKTWPEAVAGLSVLAWLSGDGRLLAGDTTGGVTFWSDAGKLLRRLDPDGEKAGE